MLSTTVTLELQLFVFPAPSATVSVTMFSPTSEQLKVDRDIFLETIPQLSKLALSMAPTVTEAVLPDKFMVTSRQIATGAVVSVTTTSALQIEKLPAASVTVRVIV